MSTISGAPITHEPWPSNVAALHLRADENGTAAVRVQPRAPRSAAAERDRGGVAVLVVGERAERGAHAAPSSPPSSGSSSSNTISPSVSVPGLVEAHDVDPGQPLDRGQLLHQHLAPGEGERRDPEGDAREQHEALGHHRHDARRP